MRLKQRQGIFFRSMKSVLDMAAPLFCSSLLNTLTRFFGMIMIAYLGPVALAAGALITTSQTALLIFFWSIMFSVGVVVGRSFGEKNYQEVGVIFRQASFLGLFIGIPASVAMWFMPHVLHLLHQPTAVVNLTDAYFHTLSFGVLPSMWSITAVQFLVGIHRPKIAMFWGAVNLPLTVLLGYLLIFGRFGFPKMGVVGFAYATTIVWWGNAMSLMIYFILNSDYKKFLFFTPDKKNRWVYMKKLFHIGWPIGIQNGSELLAWTLGTIMIGWIGEEALGAQQIVIQILLISIIVGFVIAQSGGVLVSHTLGKEKHELTRAIGYAALTLGLFVLGLIAFTYLLLPNELIRLYLDIHDPANLPIIHLAKMLLMIEAVILVVDGARNIFTGLLRGFHDTRIPMYVGLFAMWGIGIPVGYMFAFVFHWGPIGIYLASLIGVSIGALILWRRFEQHVRQR